MKGKEEADIMNHHINLLMDAISMNLAIRNRRSVFVSQFDNNRKIPDEIILEILQNANSAPTHKLTEPWRFTVFSGKGLEVLGTKQAAI